MQLPLSEAAKARGDVASVGTAVLAYLKIIPWPELAAMLACIYTTLRIAELVSGWLKKK